MKTKKPEYIIEKFVLYGCICGADKRYGKRMVISDEDDGRQILLFSFIVLLCLVAIAISGFNPLVVFSDPISLIFLLPILLICSIVPITT